jgi:hypothetical protein
VARNLRLQSQKFWLCQNLRPLNLSFRSFQNPRFQKLRLWRNQTLRLKSLRFWITHKLKIQDLRIWYIQDLGLRINQSLKLLGQRTWLILNPLWSVRYKRRMKFSELTQKDPWRYEYQSLRLCLLQICTPWKPRQQSWYLDSGCLRHMTGEKHMFQTLNSERGRFCGVWRKTKRDLFGGQNKGRGP